MASCPLLDSKLSRLLECGICLNQYKDPKELDCQHSFCLSPCLEKLFDTKTRTIKCPLCQAEQTFPDSNLHCLRSNRVIVKLLDMSTNISKYDSASKESKCDICLSVCTPLPCIHCQKQVCTTCKEHHTDEMKGDLQQGICVLTSRVEYKLSHVSQPVIKELMEKNKEKQQKIVHGTILDLINQLQLCHNQLIAELDSVYIQEDHSLKQMQSMLKETQEWYQSIQIKMNSEVMTQEKLMSLDKILHGKIREFHSMEIPKIHIPQLVFEESAKEITKQIANLGIIASDQIDLPCVLQKSDTDDKAPNSSKFSASHIASGAESDEKVWHSSKFSSSHITPDRDILVSRTKNNEFWSRKICNFIRRPDTFNGIMAVAFCPITERIIVADKHNHRIQVLDVDLSVLNVIGIKGSKTGHFYLPTDVAVMPDQSLVVLDQGNDCFHILNQTGENWKTCGTSGRHKGYLKYASCITIHNNYIYICDTGNHILLRFHLSGKPATDDELCNIHFSYPTKLVFDLHGNAYIMDNGRIRLFKSTDGNKYTECRWDLPLTHKYSTFKGIAFKMFVFHANHDLLIFSGEGKFVHQVQTRVPNQELSGICELTEGKILVFGHHTIEIVCIT